MKEASSICSLGRFYSYVKFFITTDQLTHITQFCKIEVNFYLCFFSNKGHQVLNRCNSWIVFQNMLITFSNKVSEN